MNISKRILALFLCVVLCGGIFSALPALAVEREETPPDGGYVCYLREDSLMLQSADDGLEPVPYANGYYTVDSLDELQPYLDAGLVEAVCPNEELELFDMPDINDPGAASQWYLETLNIASAWAAGYRGKGVTVAVIDSGIKADHEDFAGVNVTGYNVLGTTKAWDPRNYTDDTGHGTLVAGIIAAQSGNETGIAGLTDDVNILAIRCFSSKSDSANSGSGTVAKALTAIGYAMEQNVDVINMSFGGTGTSLKTMEPLLQQAKKQGIILVAAVGNRKSSSDAGTALNYPAAFSCVTGVGSVDKDGTVSSFSYHNSSVDVTAPGRDIYGLGYTDTSSYRTASGTSFATPMVSALAAMAKQAYPDIGQEGFENLLKSSALDQGEKGRDDYYGYGVVSASKFVEVLNASYSITYETDGGTINGTAGTDYAVSYTIAERNKASLPEGATKEYHTFKGWYTNPDCTGEPVTSVPTGTVGNVTFYAGWSPTEVDYTISGVSVLGYAAALSDTDNSTWMVTLPMETNLSALKAGDIKVTFDDSRTTYTEPQSSQGKDGKTWTFAVNEKTYTVSISLSGAATPSIKDEQLSEQTGTAAPGSYDGETEARPYTAALTDWFTGVDEETLFEAEVTDGTGTAYVDQNNVISYTPSLADAEKTVKLSVCACNRDGFSCNPVTVSINVASIPVSNSRLDESTAVYDLSLDMDGIVVNLLPYGNDLMCITYDGKTLTAETDYRLSDRPELQTEWPCTLTHTWLSELTPGVYKVDFQFSNGRTAAAKTVSLTLTVQKSYEVKFYVDQDLFDTMRTVEEAGLVLPESEPKKAGFLFDGWYTQADGGSKLAAGDTVRNDLVLYAHWKENAAGDAGSSGSSGGSGGGGSGGADTSDSTITTNPVTMSKPSNGSVSVDKKEAAEGDTVTIVVEPDNGYQIDKVTVTDKDGREIPVKDHGGGEYSFVMPDGKVTVTSTLVPVSGGRSFTDVAKDAYYADSVAWAVEKGITGGTSETTFSPDDFCTRAQMVTFLWRAMGEPETTAEGSFGDVQSGSYYERAVAWSLEKGITNGLSAGVFGSDQTVTRAQMVVFLWRLAGSPTVEGGASFTDVPAESWYAAAVRWAASTGLTKGTGETTFSPDNPCTRGQIVTFLYRYMVDET